MTIRYGTHDDSEANSISIDVSSWSFGGCAQIYVVIYGEETGQTLTVTSIASVDTPPFCVTLYKLTPPPPKALPEAIWFIISIAGVNTIIISNSLLLTLPNNELENCYPQGGHH
jgi:hypothetical protein